MDDRQYRLEAVNKPVAAASIDAYLEYKRIVGDDDGGVMFTEDQYKNYKEKVLPLREKNRLYTSWTNSTGMDCKMIGPETPCFCQHRYREHKTDFDQLPTERPIMLPCRKQGCPCKAYHFVPMLSSSVPIRCNCKHLASEHSAKEPYTCNSNSCQKCLGFTSSYSCNCGQKYTDHEMIVETRTEREARGHPVGEQVPYQAMGGITGFSSLAEGYIRLDPSGRGAPSEAYLNQPITSSDHPFLRSNVGAIQAQRIANKDYDRLNEDQQERISSQKRPGESDMDFFERRYQERLKAANTSKIACEPMGRGVRTLQRPGSKTGRGGIGSSPFRGTKNTKSSVGSSERSTPPISYTPTMSDHSVPSLESSRKGGSPLTGMKKSVAKFWARK